MRVHVSSDVDGAAGIVKWEQTTGGEPLYEEGRKRDFQTSGSTTRSLARPGSTRALCGTRGCPVLMVTGDEASCSEGKELLGDGLTTVAVKRGFGSFGARIIPPVRARGMIEEGAKRALSDPLGRCALALPRN